MTIWSYIDCINNRSDKSTKLKKATFKKSILSLDSVAFYSFPHSLKHYFVGNLRVSVLISWIWQFATRGSNGCIIPFLVSSWHFSTVYNMEHGRDPLSRTVAALCHLQLCLQGSMLATSKGSAVTGGKSKTRKYASPFSYPLSIPFFSPTLFYLTFCFSSLPLLEAICFPLPVLFGLQMPLYRNTLCWS